MENFIDDYKSWFFKRYSNKPTKRYWSFKIALNILLQRGGKNIVETGCVRQEKDWGAGMSTLHFAEFCSYYGLIFNTVDIDPEAIALAKRIIKPFDEFVKFNCMDSVKFLDDFNDPIDLLYLDSMDCDPRPEADISGPQKHQLAELKAAYPNLHDKSIVLLDDNNFENGGKAKLTKDFLRAGGWLELMTWKQSLWIKEP